MPTFGGDPGIGGFVYSLAAFDDGNGSALYVGGQFGNAAGLLVNGIVEWDGSSWSRLESLMDGAIFALTVCDDGGGTALHAGGDFSTSGGTVVSKIAKWDGSSWSPLGGGTSSTVHALLAMDDGSGPALYAGGDFTSALDSHDSLLAKWKCVDTTPPTISCPDAIFELDGLTGPAGKVVKFHVSASDPYGPAPTVVCVPPSGSYFPRGATLVTCTATDEAGNVATCSFPVIVSVPRRVH